MLRHDTARAATDKNDIAKLRDWAWSMPPETLHSIDVFDTLVTRIWSRPSDLFVALGRVLRCHRLTDMTEREFSNARRAAEKALRQDNASGETTLTEIYSALTNSTSLSPEAADKAHRLEIDLETRSLRLIRPVADLVRDLALSRRRVVATTDTYLSSGELVELLSVAGFTDLELFVSSERGASKKRGDLYNVIKKAYPHRSYSHFGDRRVADMQNAKAAGFASWMFQWQSKTKRETMLESGAWSDALAASAAGGCARAARLSGHSLSAGQQTLRSIGASVAGPLLSSFVAWVLQSALAAGNDRLLFLARDGQILHRIAGKLSPSLGIIGLEGRYTYTSRRALYLASIRSPEDVALDWLLSKIEGKTVAQALERFDLTTAELAILLGQRPLPDSRIIEAALARELREMLRAEPVMSRVLANAAKRRVLVREYMLGEVNGAKRVGIVDLGWKGRLQLCLERILVDDVSGIDGYYFALENVASFACRGTRQTFSHYHRVPNPVLVETFALADHGTLLGFRRLGHSRSVEPVLDHFEEDSHSIREMQAAILDFLTFFLDAAEIGSLEPRRALADLKEPAFRCFADLVRCPTLEEAETLGSFAHSDDQAHQNPLPIAGSIDISHIPRLIGLGPATRISYWPEASVRRLRAQHRLVGSVTRGLLKTSRLASTVRYSLRRLKRRILPIRVSP